jgi:DNA polymerase I
MGKKSKKTLILIDGNAIIHRAYHALPPLTNKKGELVNAVYGFSSTLLSVIDKFKPDYIVATFDLAGPTFRHEAFKEYKATRVKGDDELYQQIPRVKEVVKAFNIPIFEKSGFEADDMIGTLAKQAEKLPNLENIIITGDLDSLQLVSDRTKAYTMRRGITDSVLYDKDAVLERYGLKPDQLKDFKGLRGDASDNIPGVKGIGEKTAVELLKKYGSMEDVYKKLSEIKGTVKEKLEKDKMNAILSKKLGTIKTDVPLKFNLEESAVHEFDREKVVELFKELGFFSLVKRIPGNDANLRINANPRIANEKDGARYFKYEKVSPEKENEFWKLLEAQKEIALALEEKDGKLFGSFSWKTGRAHFLEINKDSKKTLEKTLKEKDVLKIGFDLKQIYKLCKKHGIEISDKNFDIMIAAYLLNPGEKITLEKKVLEELGEEIVLEKKKKGQMSFLDNAQKESEELFERLSTISDYLFRLKDILEGKIEEISREQKETKNTSETLGDLFLKIEMPLVEVLAEMETRGVKLNKTILEGISKKISVKIGNLEEKIHALAGKKFNANSPSQLSDILFNVLKIPALDIKKTKTAYSTASAELEKIKEENPIVEKIIEYRELFKLKTTYLDTLPTLADAESKVHTSFNQAVTATGRLSSSDPNLQNIPIKSELGQLMRTAFAADAGNVLIGGDYSQIDLRAVAHVSQDKKLIEAFYRGDDIHKITAAEINDVPLSKVTEKMRSSAKALNFGVIYGMGVFGFSQAAGIDRDKAKEYIDRYFKDFTGVAKYIRETKEFARKNKYVETLLGRRRNILEIDSPNFQVQNAAERMAINMPIQGLAADIVKIAMLNIHKRFENDRDVKMVLQIHDEIILEVKEERAKATAGEIKKIMEGAYKLRVPLVADVKIGENWGEI